MIEQEQPGAEPASVVEAKAWLRIEHGDEDALIAGLLRTARAVCEGFLGRALIARVVRETLASTGAWQRLGVTPVRAITGVVDAADGSVAEAETDVDANGDGWVRPSTALGMTLRQAQGEWIVVTYVAGMAADWNGVPEPVRHGIVRLVAHLYADRDGAAAGPPAAVAALWRPWRRMRLG